MTNAARKPRIKRTPVHVRRISRRHAEPLPPPSRGFAWQMRFMRWGLIALLFVVIAIALILLNHVRNDWNLAHDSKGWPTVPGVVVSTGIIDHSHRTFSFDPHVTYSYTVDGRSYIGDILRAGGYDYDSRAGVNTKLAEYPVGSTVDVLYDPENPSRSVLETGGAGGGRWWSVVGLGIGLAFGGLLVLTRYFSDYWKARR